MSLRDYLRAVRACERAARRSHLTGWYVWLYDVPARGRGLRSVKQVLGPFASKKEAIEKAREKDRRYYTSVRRTPAPWS